MQKLFVTRLTSTKCSELFHIPKTSLTLKAGIKSTKAKLHSNNVGDIIFVYVISADAQTNK